jgi:hypothetical protein
MKYIRICLAWLSSLSLLSGLVVTEIGCAKGKAPAPVVQQDTAAAASAPTAAPQPAGDQAQQASDQTQLAAAQPQQIELPDVNLTPQGLDELLAPVALYPDPVLAVMLQAATNPQELMDGGNWLVQDQNQNLKEAALDEASKKAGFTPVMQALLHYPTVVDMMCQQFDWTRQLGAAYLANPKAVLDSAQRLRAVAVDNGVLKTSDKMKVEVKQDQGKQIVELQPANPQVVYVPQYNPQQVFSSTTTTTTSGGVTTTTTTTNGVPPPTSSAVVVQQQGPTTGDVVAASLLSFGVGMIIGAAISNNNNYYYPSWGYGGVYYGGRPYYPPPYRPVYVGGWGPAHGYQRPVHYGNNNIYINNNNNYYNRFNNNSNLSPNYKPMPVQYDRKPNGVYSHSMGNQPGANQGVNYTRPNGGNPSARAVRGNQYNRPGGNQMNNLVPGNTPQQPAAGNAKNWKGQTTYQGKNPSGSNATNRPATQGGSPTPSAANRSAIQAARPSGANPANRPATQAGRPSGTSATNRPATTGNRAVDRGFGQSGGGQQNAAARPAGGNMATNRPASSNAPAGRPASPPQGAFGGASQPGADRAASARGHASMGAPQRARGSGNQAAPRTR